jgi:hypothetical protein
VCTISDIFYWYLILFLKSNFVIVISDFILVISDCNVTPYDGSHIIFSSFKI